MNGFGKTLMGVIRVSMDRTIARKISSGVTALVLVAVVLLVAAGSASAATLITNCTELQDMKNDLSGDYYLANDIDCSCTKTWNEGAGFEPISIFTGTFDGQGYTITNLFINRSATGYVGLFGYTGSGSEIKNVGLENANISGHEYVGGLVGQNDCYFTTISNSYSTGSVSGSYESVGGLVGWNCDGTINNCYWDIYRSGQSSCVGDNSGCVDCTGKNNGNSEPDYWYYSTNTPMDGWDFNNIWELNEGVTYPFFQWELFDACNGCVGLVTGHVYRCGETITESCIFNGSMRCESGQGLSIGVDGITIDGNGYAITGNKAACNCAISIFPTFVTGEYYPANHSAVVIIRHKNVVIKNLEIKNFCTGIAIRGSQTPGYEATHIRVTDCNVHDNGKPDMITHGIHMVGTRYCDITRNTIHNNDGSVCSCDGGGNGIFTMGGSTYSDGNDNTFTYNDLYENEKAGFFTKMQCKNNVISHNNITGNGVGGIVLRCACTDNTIVEHNYIADNYGTGIFFRATNNTIRYNTVINNRNGSSWTSCGYPTLSVCEHGTGIRVQDTAVDAKIYNNTICGNDAWDIKDYSGILVGDDNTCDTTFRNYNDTGTTGCTFNCSPAPDLTITEKSEEWIDQTNKTYNVTYTVKNIGDANAGASTTSIRIDGAEIATDPVPALTPDESYTVTLDSFTMSDGNDVIRICADRDNIVIEKSREYNNCLENVFWYPDMPDLVITEKSEEWVSPEDKTYNITYTVKNIGNANATESTTAIIIDGAEVATDPVELLAPQGTHTTELGPFTMSDESDMIRICADKNNIVEENNEDNNYLENIFGFSEKPDLTITEKSEEWIANNETYRDYTITYTIKNIGTGDANESTTSILIDGTEAATNPIEVLGEGGSYTRTLGPFTMTGENDTIRICADNESVIDEENEDNNYIENTFNYSQIGCIAEDATLFRCENTVMKSCTLNGDITCPDAGLIIGTDGITIDGNGYKITGSATPADCGGAGESSPCTVSGIYNSGFDNVMIKNLEIENFCTGIALADVCNIIVNNCSIHDNGFNTGNMATHGIHACNIAEGAPDDPALTITDNKIYDNEGTGAACGDGGNGIFIYAGSGDKHEYCNISNNKLHHNAKSGFWTKMVLTRSEITYNEVWGNGYGTGITDDQRGGIILRCAMSNENLIANNDVYDNDVDGIFIGGNNNTIEYNSVINNTDDGIDMGRGDGSYNNELYENSVCVNWDSDITTFGAESNTIGENNTCDSTNNYDDTGVTGCTYICGGNIVEFCAEPTKGASPLTVSFTDEARPQENKESWSWDFDSDGIEDNTTQNPLNTYTTAVSYSYYNVSLLVNWSGAGAGSASETKTEYIRVWRLDAAPNADFDTPPGVGDHTIPVTFTDTSLGEITSWRWDFGDGNTSDEQNPVHTYGTNGIYNVSLIVTGPGGLSKDTKFYCIRVGTQGAPKRPLIDAHFFADKRTGCAPFTVQFTDMSRSEGEIVSWNWDFGDGNTSNEQNPQHTYDSLGIYNVSLETMLNTGAVTNETKIDYITVSTAAPAPFVISGQVNCTSGDPVNDPGVTITNLNSSEIMPVETYAESNYYRIVVTSSDNVSAGNVLHFNVTGSSSSNPINFNHTITADEIEAGGFAQDIAVDCGFTGICGDVTCNGIVDTGDVILLSNYVGYYPGMPQYALNSTQQWAGDVTGNNVIDTGDVILLSNYVGYSGYELNCT